LTDVSTEADLIDHPLGAAVITPVGTYPGDELFQRVLPGDRISAVLSRAATELKITNTDGWVVVVDDRDIDPNQTFHEAGLRCVVEIEYHKPEGGGGT
jgi:hypothetical protein